MAAASPRWITAYTGPVWRALSIQSLLDEAGFRTHVPDATAYLAEEIVLALSVQVPESEFDAACASIATYEAPADPRAT